MPLWFFNQVEARKGMQNYSNGSKQKKQKTQAKTKTKQKQETNEKTENPKDIQTHKFDIVFFETVPSNSKYTKSLLL